MSQYTKREWKIQRGPVESYIVDQDILVVAVVSYREGKGEANAHLIAAAPKLYEALKDAKLCIENREQKGKISGINWEQLIFDIKKALALAEGKGDNR